MTNHPKEYTPKWYLYCYLENMFDNGDAERFNTWKEFFEYGKCGAHDWCMDDTPFNVKTQPWKKIEKMTDRGFAEMKQIFMERKND